MHGDTSAEVKELSSEKVGVAQEGREFNVRSCLVLAGGFAALFCTTGVANAFGVFQQYYTTHELRDETNFQIIWIASFQTFLMFALAPAAGIMTDRTGPFVPLCIGSFGLLLGTFMTSLCGAYWQFFLAQGLLMGSGMSFLSIPVIATIPHYFVKNAGLAMGIVISGSSLGGVIWPIEVDQLLFAHHLSFGWTMRIMGFTMLPLCTFVILAVRLPRSSSDEKTERKEKPRPDFSIAKNPTFALLCAGFAILTLGFFTPLFFATSYGVSLGLSPSFAFYLTSLANAASFFGRIAPGFYADKYGPFNVLVVAAISSTVVAACWTAATSTGEVIVWALAYGFTSGSFLSLQTTCATSLATPKTRGTAIGMVLGAIAIAGLFGPPISGAIIPSGYGALSAYTSAVLGAGALLIIAARYKRDKRLLVVV